jgi:hypothetical protein
MVPSVNRGETVAREKKYARTVAFRVTAREWEAIERIINIGAPIWAPAPTVCKTPTAVVRAWISAELENAIEALEAEEKRNAAKAKRAAKKAANGDTQPA